jgi:hypothetical protein
MKTLGLHAFCVDWHMYITYMTKSSKHKNAYCIHPEQYETIVWWLVKLSNWLKKTITCAFVTLFLGSILGIFQRELVTLCVCTSATAFTSYYSMVGAFRVLCAPSYQSSFLEVIEKNSNLVQQYKAKLRYIVFILKQINLPLPPVYAVLQYVISGDPTTLFTQRNTLAISE